MSPVAVGCPTCGAPVEFRYDDSLVRVCSHCNSVVARGDRGPESLGRMADLAPSASGLALLVEGKLDGVGFTLVGRAQLLHPAGGGWEEWYAHFNDDRWGWLSESQGRFHLSFDCGAVANLPPLGALRPGLQVTLALPQLGQQTFVVSEVSQGTYRAAAGEMPYRLDPKQPPFFYADLSGPGGIFATIDYGSGPHEKPAVYAGRELRLADLQLVRDTGTGLGDMPPAQVARGKAVACTQCGGSLELRAPDITLRVTCPYCDAVLDLDQGNLSYLRTLSERERVRPDLPLGTLIEFEERELTIIGLVCRCVTVDGTDYPFREFLLYHPELGYRWLVESDGHWSYVCPLPAGDLANSLAFVGRRQAQFRHFQSAPARVTAVFGEFYWKVVVGEGVVMHDHVSPPYMLSSEENESEVNWSLGMYLKGKDLLRRLKLAKGAKPPVLPGARGVGPHQPFRFAGMARATLAAVGLLLAGSMALAAMAPNRQIPLELEDAALPTPEVEPGAAPPPPQDPGNVTVVRFSKPFSLDGKHNFEIHAKATNLANSWVYLAADLVNDDTGSVESVDFDLEYYSGVEDGESWSEGDYEKTAWFRPVEAGKYLLRIEMQHPRDKPPAVALTVREGVWHFGAMLFFLILLLLLPALIGLYSFFFENKRWSQSDHPRWQSSGDDDDD